MRLKETPNVVLIGSNRKMVTLFVNKAKKQDHHAYLKKSAKRLNQAQKTKGLKYQEVHEFVWEESGHLMHEIICEQLVGAAANGHRCTTPACYFSH